MNGLIWQCDSYKKSAVDAMREFADTYWDKPRKIKVLSAGVFMMRNGFSTYYIENGISNGLHVWQIYKREVINDKA